MDDYPTDLFGVPLEEIIRRRKEIKLEQALKGTTDEYQQSFLRAVWNRAETGAPFTSEDVTFDVGLPHEDVDDLVNRNNAVGALMNTAARFGIIEKTGRMVPAKRMRSNGRELREWVGVIAQQRGAA